MPLPPDHPPQEGVADERSSVSDGAKAHRQLTERTAVELERALLAAIVESSDDAIVSKRLDGTITSWNPAAERLYGWSVDEACGQHITLLFPPEAGDELPGIMERLQQGERIEHFETVRRRKDGTRVHISLSISPVKDAQGRVIGAAGIGRDITEQKRLAEELRQRVAQLAERNRRQDEFLAMLAHELRNPLAPIRNAAEVIQLVGQTEPRLQWASGVVERQVQHLSCLVDDLLDVSRITQGMVKLHKEPVELSAVVGRALETARPSVEARKHELTLSLPGEPIRLEGDALRLAQVVTNLLNNAAKFTPEGGHIWLSAGRERGQAVVRVKDNGVGLAPGMLPRVFDLFAQADRSLDRSQGGLGIGLTLVRGLVEMHGGVVEALSDGPGRGSEFVVRLPGLHEPPALLDGDVRNARSLTTNPVSRRVLVVEDNCDAAESIARLVEMWGHEVRQAHDGPQALGVAAEYHPQVILLDMGLPGLSGLEVAARLRQDPTFADTVVVMVTGYGQDEDRRQSREAGVDYHWVKPVEPDRLRCLLGAVDLGRQRGHGPGQSP
jgi:PAS domain S-box-containing protein